MNSENNFKSPVSGMDIYGEPRMTLAILLRDKVLNKLDMPWTIENGTLLGAWRNGSFIQHDDDFDIALFCDINPIPRIPAILEKIKQLLPAPYEARQISTYADKIEVYDPTYGEYKLYTAKYHGASYHHCTVDLQFYQRFGETYRSLYYADPQTKTVHYKDMYPLSKIELEGEIFQAPYNVEGFLKSLYGSLSPKAKYNTKTGFYEVREEVEETIHSPILVTACVWNVKNEDLCCITIINIHTYHDII